MHTFVLVMCASEFKFDFVHSQDLFSVWSLSYIALQLQIQSLFNLRDLVITHLKSTTSLF